MVVKICIIPKKASNKSFSASNFRQKSPQGAYISHQSGARGSKDDIVLDCTEMENCIHFWAECCQKYAIFPKKLQIKVFWHQILDKKVSDSVYPSPSGVELRGSKDDMV